MPTLKEQGIDVFFAVNRGVCAPLKTPQFVIDKLAKAFKQVSEDPEFTQRLGEMGTDAVYRDPIAYKAYIDRSTTVWTPLAEKIGLNKK